MSADTSLPANTWSNVYAATGITPGTPIQIFNKAIWDVTVQEAAVQPGAASRDGPCICRADTWIADQSGVTGCWVWSPGPIWINVQVMTDA